MPGKEIEQAFATMSHGRTRYFEAGSGPDVLLVHGAGFVSGGHNWLLVMPALAESFHVYAVDCLGFGPGDHLEQPYSFAYLVDHLREFQDVMGMASSHVVGHSMGGWLGVLLAYESPHRVKRLVDVAGGGMRTRALHGMIEWSPPDEDAVRASLARLQGTAVEELEPELVAERVKAAGDPAVTAAFRRLMDHMTDPETRQRYGTMRRMPFIRVPTLVLWGADDPVNSPEMAMQASELIPGAQLTVLDGIGHGVAQEAPSEFCRAVTSFLLA